MKKKTKKRCKKILKHYYPKVGITLICWGNVLCKAQCHKSDYNWLKERHFIL